MKREEKIIIGIMIIFFLLGVGVTIIYSYMYNDHYTEKWESGYIEMNGMLLPYCPDVPRINQEAQDQELRKRRPRPKINLKNIEGGNVRITLKNKDKYPLIYGLHICYGQDEELENCYATYIPLKEDSNKVVLENLEIGKTYYIQIKCDDEDYYTKWSKVKKVKIKK